MASDPTDGYKIASIRAVQTFLAGCPASSNPVAALPRIQWPASIESGARFRSNRATIQVNADNQAAFAALTTGIEHWWTSEAGKFEKIGDVAKFGFSGKRGYWTFEAVTLEPDLIEWECVEALHIHEGQPKEIETKWLGTRAIWTLRDRDGGTEIRLQHKGLTPDLLCYDICEAGWDMFFVDSLKAYLDTGTGKPFTGE